VTRLGATVALSRSLQPYQYGLAAIVLTTYEFTSTFTSVGITAKIVHANEEDLEKICNGAYWLNCVLFISLFIIQCLMSIPISLFYNETDLILPICLLSLNYLVGPVGSIQSALIKRENRLKIIALGTSLQMSAASVLSAIFALMGLGMWAVVLPRVLSFPISNFVYLRNHSWRLSSGFTTEHWGEIFDYGRNILGLCLLKTLRNNLDYLIVATFLSVKDLGTYYFAFNAGLGISMTIINSINSALFPYLCKFRTNYSILKLEFFKVLKIIALIIIPFVAFQTSMANWYVPIIFGDKWVTAIPILILICLSAIPRPFVDAATILLMTHDKPQYSLRLDMLFTVFFMTLLFFGVQWGAIGVALAVLTSYVIFVPGSLLWTMNFVFNRGSKTQE
jgi:PST family polysaccharide transporter